MKNIKLGDTTYEGVTAVKLDTEDGGTATFELPSETPELPSAEGVSF